MAYNVTEYYGTPNAEVLTGLDYSVAFGLGGDDVLYGGLYLSYSYLFGGAGNDTFIVDDYRSAIVYDTQEFDTLSLGTIDFQAFDTVFTTLNDRDFVIGRHLSDSSFYNFSIVIIPDYQSTNSIEVFQYNNKSVPANVFFQEVFASSTYYPSETYASLGVADQEIQIRTNIQDFINKEYNMQVFQSSVGIPIDVNDAIEVARLYEAGFGRVPDIPGMNFWIDALENGMSLEVISKAFVTSNEFTTRFGDVNTLSNEAYIDVLYNNVLGREPETAGYNYWVNTLNKNLVSDEQALILFASSDENKAGTAYLDSMYLSNGDWLF